MIVRIDRLTLTNGMRIFGREAGIGRGSGGYLDCPEGFFEGRDRLKPVLLDAEAADGFGEAVD